MYPVVLNTTFPSQIEMGVLVFGEQEKLSEKGQEPTMNYNRIWHQVQKSNQNYRRVKQIRHK